MVWCRSVLAIAAVVLVPLAASAEERLLALEPERTSVTFTLKATGHEVHGVLALESGEIRFDPGTGRASGRVTIDLRRTETGNRLRDREMHANVLETERFPLIVFRPDRLEGALAPSGTSDVTLHGVVALHGAEHRLALPARVTLSDGRMTAQTTFDVPYVAWGLHNPSILFLRVASVVAVTVKAEGRVSDSVPARDARAGDASATGRP